MTPDDREKPDAPSHATGFTALADDIIERMPLGVVLFDCQLRILAANARARTLLRPHDQLAAALASTEHDAEDPWAQRLTAALQQDQPTTFENVDYQREHRRCVLRAICMPLGCETDATPAGMLLLEDVTRTVAMQNDLAAAERLAAVGKLAAKVAHELNNPLDGILRYINLAARICQETGAEQVGRYLQESRKGLLRMTRIVSELLEFSRNTSSAAEEANINKLAEEAARSLEAVAMENGVNIFREFHKPMPNVRSGNLFQVFTNLIKNAIDAMEPDGGQLWIRTRRDDSDAVIEFADTGPGLSEDIRDRLFEPFFTTKPLGKGTGLGLAICRDIVERYGGRIAVANGRSAGAVFTVHLPLERTSAAGATVNALD